MTAYLQPGDKIHIILPISPALTGNPLQAQIQKDVDQIRAAYAAVGVDAYMVSHSSTATVASVVAVFRSPNPKGATS